MYFKIYDHNKNEYTIKSGNKTLFYIKFKELLKSLPIDTYTVYIQRRNNINECFFQYELNDLNGIGDAITTIGIPNTRKINNITKGMF